jgi:hypothetical protein
MVQVYVGQKLGAKTPYIHMIWMWDIVYGVWSLNHDITTSLGLSHTPNIKKSPPAPAQA